MPHKSRLGTIVFDCKEANMDAAADFWAAATGSTAEPETEGFPDYRELSFDGNDPKMLVQYVTHESRVHIDIETDNKEAECARLEKIGARMVKKVDGPGKNWIIMEAPTGHRFCLVGPQRPDFAENANQWGSS